MNPRHKITIIPLSGPTQFDEVLEEAVARWNEEFEDVDCAIDDDADNGLLGEEAP